MSKGSHHVTTMSTTRGFYPAVGDPSVGPISEAFNGQADSQVGLDAGLTRDIWTVANPSLQPIQSEINRGDTLFERLMGSLTPKQINDPAVFDGIRIERARAIAGLAGRYVSHPWAINFLLIVSPLVTWIWLGAIVIAVGGLIALWPVPSLARRRVRSGGAVRGGCAGSAPVTRASPRDGPENGMEFVIVLLVLVAVVYVVTAPLRAEDEASARGEAAAGPRGGRPRGARGRARREVPRDPRRPARSRHGQALRRGFPSPRGPAQGRGPTDPRRDRAGSERRPVRRETGGRGGLTRLSSPAR